MTKFFFDPEPRPLKLQLDQDIVILTICVKPNQSWPTNAGARAMTKLF